MEDAKFEMKIMGAYNVPQIDIRKSWTKSKRDRCTEINRDLLSVAQLWHSPTSADFLQAFVMAQNKPDNR